MRHKFTVQFSVEIEFDSTEMTIEQAVNEITESMHFPCEDTDNVTIMEQCVTQETGEIQPEPKNPGKYRMLEIGDIIQSDDEYLFPEGWQLIPSIMVGDEFNADCDAQSVRRPIAELRYRPFKEGDVIEEGDQFLYKGEWDSFSSLCYGEEINAQYIPTSRKLIN